MKFFWTYSPYFALGPLVSSAFAIDDWRFWVVVVGGAVFLVTRDEALSRYEK